MAQADSTVVTMARSLELTREAAEHATRDPEDLNQFRDKMNAYLRSEVDPEFFSHWNVIPSPFVVDEAECRGLFDQAIALHDAVEFVLDAYMDGQPEVRALYDRYDVLSDEFSKCAATWQGWGRYDFLLSDGARPVFIETNAAMASGMLPMNYLNEFYRHHVPEGIAPFHAKDTSIAAPSQTIALADSKGARKGSPNLPYGTDGSGVYVIDPPLGSVDLGSRGSRQSSATPGSGNAYYEGGNDGSDAHRATPSERNSGRANWVGVDGHAETATLRQLDGQGTSPNSLPNNAWWNGRFDPTAR